MIFMEQQLGYISLCLAMIGVFLVLFFSPSQKYEERSITEITENCEGFVKIEGELQSTFYSKKGNYIGIIADKNASVMVLFEDNFFFDGDEITLCGSASEYSGACWLFPEKVELA